MAANIEAITIESGYITIRTNSGPPQKFPTLTSLTTQYRASLTGGATGAIGNYVDVTQPVVSSGWALAYFGSVQLTCPTQEVVGSAAGGVFEVNMTSAFAGSTSGIVCGLFVGAYGNSASDMPTCGLWIETIVGSGLSFAADGSPEDMPILALVTSGAGIESSLAIEFGSEMANKQVTTGAGGMFHAQNIQVKVNGTLMYWPLSSTEGMFKYADKAEFNKTFAAFDTYNDLFGINLTMNVALTTGKYLDILYIGHYGTGNIDNGAEYYPLWVDLNGSGANNGVLYMARFSRQAGAPIPTAYIQFESASPGIEHLFRLAGDFVPWDSDGTDCTDSGATDPRGTIAIREPDGTTVYIRCWNDK